jgi:hypothetical protein
MTPMLDLDPELAALTRRLDADGYDYKVKSTRHGLGLTLIVSGKRRLPGGGLSTQSLRAACLQVHRDGLARVGRDGHDRIRLRDVARRLGVPAQTVGRALDAAGVTLQLKSGRTWIVRDVAWNRFIGPPPTPKRTPVLA